MAAHDENINVAFVLLLLICIKCEGGAVTDLRTGSITFTESSFKILRLLSNLLFFVPAQVKMSAFAFVFTSVQFYLFCTKSQQTSRLTALYIVKGHSQISIFSNVHKENVLWYFNVTGRIKNILVLKNPDIKLVPAY